MFDIMMLMRSFPRNRKTIIYLILVIIVALGVIILIIPRKHYVDRLTDEKTNFPYPSGFRITEDKFIDGTQPFCIDLCSRRVIYGVFDKPTTNIQAFSLFQDSMKKVGYKIGDTDIPYYQLSLESIDSPRNENTFIHLQVWPEPAIVPGGGDTAPNPMPEVPVQWVELTFE